MSEMDGDWYAEEDAFVYHQTQSAKIKALKLLNDADCAINALWGLKPEQYRKHQQNLIDLRSELDKILTAKYNEWYASPERRAEQDRKDAICAQKIIRTAALYNRTADWVVKNLQIGDIILLKGTRNKQNAWRVFAGFDKYFLSVIGDFIDLKKDMKTYTRRGGSAENGAGNVQKVYRDGVLIFNSAKINDYAPKD